MPIFKSAANACGLAPAITHPATHITAATRRKVRIMVTALLPKKDRWIDFADGAAALLKNARADYSDAHMRSAMCGATNWCIPLRRPSGNLQKQGRNRTVADKKQETFHVKNGRDGCMHAAHASVRRAEDGPSAYHRM
ncbi:hypothetical protein K6V72_23235 [Ralstonia insidiosa]|nr:hypothetical protein [Ralstonia insidiosa]MBY4911932.1 hypothetical protein [Ralstonia insidiosa]